MPETVFSFVKRKPMFDFDRSQNLQGRSQILEQLVCSRSPGTAVRSVLQNFQYEVARLVQTAGKAGTLLH